MSESQDEKVQFSELLEKYMELYEMYFFEGDPGLSNLNRLANDLGYAGHQFKYGSPLEHFLSDNPGAQQAIVEWLSGRNDLEFRERLEETLNENSSE